jgi:hypothetical protein
MNADFEKQLQGQPLRELPRDWRGEILAAASGSPNGRAVLPRRPEMGRSGSFALPDNEICRPREVVSTWPSLRAWAGLAAAWVVIFLLHVTAPDEPRLARSSSSATTMSFAKMQEQTLMMAQLLGQPDQADAGDVPAALPAPPKPRSEIARKQLVG